MLDIFRCLTHMDDKFKGKTVDMITPKLWHCCHERKVTQ
jgi:hypothetical protein